MTYEEFINSYGFKHASKLAMRKFPWIKKIFVNEDDYNEYKFTYFLEVHINPNIFSKTVTDAGTLMVTSNWRSPFANLSVIYSNISDKEGDEISSEIDTIFNKVKMNDAIPKNINLQKSSRVTGYYI